MLPVVELEGEIDAFEHILGRGEGGKEGKRERGKEGRREVK